MALIFHAWTALVEAVLVVVVVAAEQLVFFLSHSAKRTTDGQSIWTILVGRYNSIEKKTERNRENKKESEREKKIL